ncbi:MAG TPA: UDP-N-acetylmuramoyl-tripeptide--D-alanyl-D-alanine ligase, partial [Fimbriimonadaceae bacterium]|nr:UDP-N-acetylmuramoyl-tripeptide--D-alanyl-D-alanine ligase [Fimbriimonadaceae bacterium]
MKPISLADFAGMVGGELVAKDSSPEIQGFATDSRQVVPGDLFLAIKGARTDGHEYVPIAIENGAIATLAERPVKGPYILVADLVQALAKMAAHYRDQFQGSVIGITGSAGKTTTKELLAAALAPIGKVVKTEGNRNTEFTAPLLWPEVTADTKAVVVEMAMRGKGQIAHLAFFSKPTVGLVTNIGWSHVGEVGSREGIAEAKSELLNAVPRDGIAILPVDDEFFSVLEEHSEGRQIYTFGTSDSADCRVIKVQSEGWDGSTINGFFADIPWQVHLPYLGLHLGLNVAAAICACAGLGLAPQEAADAMGEAVLPPMRMQVLEWRGIHVLLDAYNASPSSMRAAIDTFMELPCEGNRYAIIGQMNELGAESELAHRELINYMQQQELANVWTFGDLWAQHGLSAPEPDIESLRSSITILKPGDSILIKG